jgi:hypothetical protein
VRFSSKEGQDLAKATRLLIDTANAAHNGEVMDIYTTVRRTAWCRGCAFALLTMCIARTAGARLQDC